MVKRRSRVLALFLPLVLSGCPDDSDLDLPDRDRIPEPGLRDDGPLERAGRRADRFADEAGDTLRHRTEEAGDAAERAGDWIERKTDEDGVVDDHDVPR